MAASQSGSWLALLVILMSLMFTERTETKVVEGLLLTTENWAFLSRFCFLSQHGQFQYDIIYDIQYAVQNIDLYYDSETQWSRVYRNNELSSCRDKESVLKAKNNQFINLTHTNPLAGCHIVFDADDEEKNDNMEDMENVDFPGIGASKKARYLRCKGARNFNTARDRWWFVAISNCNSTKGLQMRYKLVMTNGNAGDLLHEHFSADEFYILPALALCLLIHLTIFFLTIAAAVVLRGRQMLHTTFKLFIMAVIAQLLGVSSLVFHYTVYSIDGEGVGTLQVLGLLLEGISEVFFLLLLVLVAKGFTVTRGRLRTVSAIKISVLVSLYAIILAALLYGEQTYMDPGKVLYRYDSLFGYLFIMLRLMGWLLFLYAIVFTLKHYPEKAAFYTPLAMVFSLWFVFAPGLVMVANHILADWVRQKVVVVAEHTITIVGHAFFLYLTRPDAHNTNFPFHVRTSQIGVMQTTTTSSSEPNTLDAFAHGGSYSVRSARTAADLFTVDSVDQRNSHRSLKGLNDRRTIEGVNGSLGGQHSELVLRPPRASASSTKSETSKSLPVIEEDTNDDDQSNNLGNNNNNDDENNEDDDDEAAAAKNSDSGTENENDGSLEKTGKRRVVYNPNDDDQ